MLEIFLRDDGFLTPEKKRALKRHIVRIIKDDELNFNCKNASLSVWLTGDGAIKEYNRKYRKRNKATNVLSFPDGTKHPDGVFHIGDIIISAERAKKSARALSLSLAEELKHLVAHAILSLAGFSHKKTPRRMMELEEKFQGAK